MRSRRKGGPAQRSGCYTSPSHLLIGHDSGGRRESFDWLMSGSVPDPTQRRCGLQIIEQRDGGRAGVLSRTHVKTRRPHQEYIVLLHILCIFDIGDPDISSTPWPCPWEPSSSFSIRPISVRPAQPPNANQGRSGPRLVGRHLATSAKSSSIGSKRCRVLPL